MTKAQYAKTHRTRDALQILERITGSNARVRGQIEAASDDLHVAQLIYDARVAAGLTQRQLAKRAGTRQPVIARLENAAYEGHSLNMLKRITDALGLRIELKIVPIRSEGHARPASRSTARRKLVA